MVKNRWRIQNRLYHMKDKKLKLERLLESLKKHREPLDNFSLSKKEGEPFSNYCLDILKLFLLELDKLVEIYYLKITTFFVMKKVEKVIKELTKEIVKYEQY